MSAPHKSSQGPMRSTRWPQRLLAVSRRIGYSLHQSPTPLILSSLGCLPLPANCLHLTAMLHRCFHPRDVPPEYDRHPYSQLPRFGSVHGIAHAGAEFSCCDFMRRDSLTPEYSRCRSLGLAYFQVTDIDGRSTIVFINLIAIVRMMDTDVSSSLILEIVQGLTLSIARKCFDASFVVLFVVVNTTWGGI